MAYLSVQHLLSKIKEEECPLAEEVLKRITKQNLFVNANEEKDVIRLCALFKKVVRERHIGPGSTEYEFELLMASLNLYTYLQHTEHSQIIARTRAGAH